ncbi:General secretion pathway protein F [Granulibacter bethesdensis]|uniref:type II secretion system F family protein n=1 Tax=Granulibacter bethesdensis TaxID=364410 RepID=UPI00090BB2A7|nr:type II secretion system F family protein [Granulibacter bethesdensis]APH57598.1 General secretion pathway protein F [Granulibacter bethesdensis]
MSESAHYSGSPTGGTAFRFTALSTTGEITQGTLYAASVPEAETALHGRGLVPLEIAPLRLNTLMQRLRRPMTGMKQAELTRITRELSIMLETGQDLDRALRFVGEHSARRESVRLIEAVRNRVRDGSPLADAMAEHPRAFPPLYTGMVRAGEAGGSLAATLDRLAAYLERQQTMNAALVSALIYPALLLVTATGAVLLLLTQVLPEFAPLFEQNMAAMPASTRFLLALSRNLSVWLPTALVLMLGLLAGVWWLLRRDGPRLAADRFGLRLPLIGAIWRELLAARLTRTLGSLLVNGVPLINALGIARETLGNRAAVNAVRLAAQNASEGGSFANALAEQNVFPARTIALLRLGEESARLGPLCLRAADIHEDTFRIRMQRAVSLVTPSITVAMGAMVAGIVSSVLMAMLSLNDLASQ